MLSPTIHKTTLRRRLGQESDDFMVSNFLKKNVSRYHPLHIFLLSHDSLNKKCMSSSCHTMHLLWLPHESCFKLFDMTTVTMWQSFAFGQSISVVPTTQIGLFSSCCYKWETASRKSVMVGESPEWCCEPLHENLREIHIFNILGHSQVLLS